MKLFKSLLAFSFIIIIVGHCEKTTAPHNPLYNNNDDPDKDMVCVPAGAFTMGSNSGGLDEKPVHNVYLDAYYIDKYEVTNAQYVAFLNEALSTGGIQACNSTVTKDDQELLDLNDPYCQISFNGNRFSVKDDKAFYPVIEVSWYGADAYAKHYGKRLPTEAEWEKAARGSDGRPYPWGNNGPDSSNCNCKDYVGHTTPVGQYSPVGDSPYGCFDMIGNVWEWCNDWYDANYYANSPTNNPKGPVTGATRVMRGGSWDDHDRYLRVARRVDHEPTLTFNSIGFRCAK